MAVGVRHCYEGRLRSRWILRVGSFVYCASGRTEKIRRGSDQAYYAAHLAWALLLHSEFAVHEYAIAHFKTQSETG